MYSIILAVHSALVGVSIPTLLLLDSQRQQAGDDVPSWFVTTLVCLLFVTMFLVIYANTSSSTRTITFSSESSKPDGTERLLKVTTDKHGAIYFCYTVDGLIVYDGPESNCPLEIAEEIREYRRVCLSAFATTTHTPVEHD